MFEKITKSCPIAAELAAVCGPAAAEAILAGFAGRAIYIPSLKTQRNLSIPEVVREHTKGLSGAERQKVLSELAATYKMKRWQLIRLAKRH